MRKTISVSSKVKSEAMSSRNHSLVPATMARKAETVRIKKNLPGPAALVIKAEDKEKEKRIAIFSKEKQEACVTRNIPLCLQASRNFSYKCATFLSFQLQEELLNS